MIISSAFPVLSKSFYLQSGKIQSSRSGVTNLFEPESNFIGTQFDTLICNDKFARFAFSYILLLMINDTHLREDCSRYIMCSQFLSF